MSAPEDDNVVQIERLASLLRELRDDAGTARETEAIREIGLEIALAIREVGAMLVSAGSEQAIGRAASTREGPADGA